MANQGRGDTNRPGRGQRGAAKAGRGRGTTPTGIGRGSTHTSSDLTEESNNPTTSTQPPPTPRASSRSPVRAADVKPPPVSYARAALIATPHPPEQSSSPQPRLGFPVLESAKPLQTGWTAERARNEANKRIVEENTKKAILAKQMQLKIAMQEQEEREAKEAKEQAEKEKLVAEAQVKAEKEAEKAKQKRQAESARKKQLAKQKKARAKTGDGERQKQLNDLYAGCVTLLNALCKSPASPIHLKSLKTKLNEIQNVSKGLPSGNGEQYDKIWGGHLVEVVIAGATVIFFAKPGNYHTLSASEYAKRAGAAFRFEPDQTFVWTDKDYLVATYKVALQNLQDSKFLSDSLKPTTGDPKDGAKEYGIPMGPKILLVHGNNPEKLKQLSKEFQNPHSLYMRLFKEFWHEPKWELWQVDRGFYESNEDDMNYQRKMLNLGLEDLCANYMFRLKIAIASPTSISDTANLQRVLKKIHEAMKSLPRSISGRPAGPLIDQEIQIKIEGVDVRLYALGDEHHTLLVEEYVKRENLKVGWFASPSNKGTRLVWMSETYLEGAAVKAAAKLWSQLKIGGLARKSGSGNSLHTELRLGPKKLFFVADSPARQWNWEAVSNKLKEDEYVELFRVFWHDPTYVWWDVFGGKCGGNANDIISCPVKVFDENPPERDFFYTGRREQ